MLNKLLFIDTETGGIDPNLHSLLSIGLVVWQDKKIIDTLEVFIKRKKYSTTETALKINKIDLNELRKKGLEPKEAMDIILRFINKNFNEKATLVGHNLGFDVGFFKEFFKENKIDYNNFFSYRGIDTASILKYLSISKKLKKNVNSLDDAIEYFNLEVDENKRHTALTDSYITAKLFEKLIELQN